MKKSELRDELTFLLNSKTVECVWLETYEEERAINLILDCSKKLTSFSPNVSVWSHTQGLKRLPKSEIEKREEFKPELAHPKKMFEHILKTQTENGAQPEIFILRDLHLINSTHEIIRIIRDIKEYTSKNYCPIIIVSPVVQIPLEHEKIFHVLSLDMPSKQEVLTFVNAAINKIENNPDKKKIEECLQIIKNVKEGNKEDEAYSAKKIKDKIGKDLSSIMVTKLIENRNISVKDMYEYITSENSKMNAKKGIVPTEKEKAEIVSALCGLTEKEIIAAIFRSVKRHGKLVAKDLLEEKIQLIKKAGVLDYKVPTALFSDIGGNHKFKDWIQEVEMSMSPEAEEFGCSSPKGYLALGIPGCSKTFSAEALANKWNVPFLKLNMSKIFDKLVGQSEKKIEQALKIASACAPCVLLIDEIEKALSGKQSI